MDKLNLQESIKAKVLSFDDSIIYRTIDPIFYTIVHGFFVLLLGMFSITAMAFNDIWPAYSFEFVLLLTLIIGGLQYWSSQKLKVYAYTSNSLKPQLNNHFRALGWVVLRNNKSLFHARKTHGKSESNVYVIYEGNSVLASAAVGMPFPFSLLSSRKIEKEIGVMATSEI